MDNIDNSQLGPPLAIAAPFPGAFAPWPKIPRFSREIIVTEKLDGTNASVLINDAGTLIQAGSRTRWIYPANDNQGFAKWVEKHKEELLKLGPGHHFGEWWGKGIQRGYGLNEKRFSLFNASRWGVERPACCGVVPVLYQGSMSELAIESCIAQLCEFGSVAAPGFMKPEGVVVFHTAANSMFKKTLVGDAVPKGAMAQKEGE